MSFSNENRSYPKEPWRSLFVAGEDFEACPVAVTVVEEGGGPPAKADVVHAQAAEVVGDGGTQFAIEFQAVGLFVFADMEGEPQGVLPVQPGDMPTEAFRSETMFRGRGRFAGTR